MEKDPTFEAQIGNESLNDRKNKSGFLDRWQKRRQEELEEIESPTPQPAEKVEPEPTFTEKITDFVLEAFVKQPKEELKPQEVKISDKNEVLAVPELDEEQEQTVDLEDLQDVTQKIGNKVLRFATGVLGDTQKTQEALPGDVVDELAESTQHLQEELGELREVSSDWAQKNKENEPRPPERTEELENKVPAFAGVLMATLAIAGAGIFMATVEPEHRREHRILKKHRKHVAKFIIKHKKELEHQEQQIREQQIALSEQTSDLQELKVREIQHSSKKEQSTFIHQVSQLAEQQADITHEVVKQSREHIFREVLTGEIVHTETQSSPETEGSGRQSKGTTHAGLAGSMRNNASPSLDNNATLLQKLFAEPTVQGQKVSLNQNKPAWLFVAIFTTLVITTIAWLVVQLVVSG